MAGFKCFECNKPAHHAHHVIPKSKGGKRTIPLCKTCHEMVHDHANMNIEQLHRDGIKRALKAGVKFGPPPKYNINHKEILLLREQGHTWKQIGQRLGVNWHSIRSRINDALNGTYKNGSTLISRAEAQRYRKVSRATSRPGRRPNLNKSKSN